MTGFGKATPVDDNDMDPFWKISNKRAQCETAERLQADLVIGRCKSKQSSRQIQINITMVYIRSYFASPPHP